MQKIATEGHINYDVPEVAAGVRDRERDHA